jgi:hypothetical protein
VGVDGLDLTNIVALGLLESDFLDQRFIENSPDFPIFVANAHVLVILSENNMKFLKI